MSYWKTIVLNCCQASTEVAAFQRCNEFSPCCLLGAAGEEVTSKSFNSLSIVLLGTFWYNAVLHCKTVSTSLCSRNLPLCQSTLRSNMWLPRGCYIEEGRSTGHFPLPLGNGGTSLFGWDHLPSATSSAPCATRNLSWWKQRGLEMGSQKPLTMMCPRLWISVPCGSRQ